MKKLFFCGVTLAVSMVMGCANEPLEQAPGEEGFALIQHDARTLEATYRSGAASVRVLVDEAEAGVVDVTYDFGDSLVAFHVDYNQGTGDFMPGGSPLDAAQAQLLDSLLEGLTKSVPPDGQRTRVEETSVRQTSFMQIVPVGEVLTPYHYVSERGWTHISCSCGSQYIGSGYYRQAGRGCGCNGGGGNGCKGRCGQGCGITSAPACVGTTAYTQDCAKHDYGLGTFQAASDDYTFASNNCSCSGVGTCY
ncbi:hypothetical protein WME99_50860 [Sorangium sp. So ce136]|uniref:hypothetical protein n=1 Tax=Sorangium sp. So ce136 TaxID=3133284 RepID=UPI003F055AC2